MCQKREGMGEDVRGQPCFRHALAEILSWLLFEIRLACTET